MSWALPIFERPSIPSLAASRRSSVTVIAPAPLPVPLEAPRFRAAALAPSRPRSRRVLLDSLAMVFFLRAPFWAFFTFARAARRCFSLATTSAYPDEKRHMHDFQRPERVSSRNTPKRRHEHGQGPWLERQERQAVRGPSKEGYEQVASRCDFERRGFLEQGRQEQRQQPQPQEQRQRERRQHRPEEGRRPQGRQGVELSRPAEPLTWRRP